MLLKGLPRQQFLSSATSTWNSGSRQRCTLNSSSRKPKLRSAREGPSSAPTLFEELFPEESKLPRNPQSSSGTKTNSKGPSRDGLLREFGWAMTEARDGASQAQNRFMERQECTASTTDQDDYDLRKYRNASVLALSNASKSLAFSDFLRLSPKGSHIDNWASGIKNVIPGRSPHTLEALPHYFIVFSSPAAALAYQSSIQRLHRLTRANTPSSPSSPLPPPPGYIQDGEDLYALMQAFTLVPPSLEHPSCRMLKQPFSDSVNRMIEGGGIIASQTRRRMKKNREKAGTRGREKKAEGEGKEDGDGSDMVLLTLQGEGADSHLTPHDVRALVARDSKERNLPWGLLAAREGEDIIRLETKAEAEAEVRMREGNGDGIERERSDHHQTQSTESRPKLRRKGPGRFLLTFKDPRDARRFVRAWHRRALPLPLIGGSGSLSGKGVDGQMEMSPLISAELLW